MVEDKVEKLLDGKFFAVVSTRQDGTMLNRALGNRHDPISVENRRHFLRRYNLDYDDAVYQIIQYGEDQGYDRIVEVSDPDQQGIAADVLVTKTPGLILFLPVADCIGIVLYNSKRNILALAHIGRHASIAKTIQKAITYMNRIGSKSEDIKVWMSPNISKDDYRLDYFDYINDPDWQDFANRTDDGIYLDLQGYNARLAINAGVPAGSIRLSTINTALDGNYFSHYQGDTSGRFAVAAMIR